MTRLFTLAAALMVMLGAGVAEAGGPASPVDPAARLLRDDDASEHWDLAAHFESGHRLYARFLITNEGPGKHTAVAFGHVLKPDGEAVAFRNGRREGAWQLSDGGRRIKIGSSLLQFGRELRRFEVDNDKRGIKIHFEVAADAPGLAAPPAPAGARLDLLNLASPATGTLWLTGMPEPLALEGHVLITHSWYPGGEHDAVLRRTDFATFGAGDGLFLSDVLTPDGRRWSWVATTTRTGELASHPNVRIESRSAEKSEVPYPIPDRLELGGKSLAGSISLEAPPVLVSDPLDALPSLLKMVYSFGGRPRHLWANAVANIVLEPRNADPTRRIQSAGIAAFFFGDATP